VTRPRLGLTLAVAAVSVLLFGLLLAQTSRPALAWAWERLPASALALSLGLYLALNFLRALRFRALLTGERLTLAAALRVTAWSNFFSRLLPFKSGDLAYPLLLRDKVAHPWTQGLSGLAGSYLFESFYLALAGLAAGVSLAGSNPAWPKGLNWLLGLAAVLVPALILFAGRLAGRLGRAWEGRRPAWAARVGRLAEALDQLRASFWPVLGLSALTFAANAGWPLVLLAAGLPDLAGGPALGCVVLVMLASNLPLSLFGLGLTEGAWALGLTGLAGLPLDQAVAFGLVAHAAQLAWAGLTAALGGLIRPGRT
jgi:hypothetical protein